MKVKFGSEEYKSFEFNVIVDPLDRIENWIADCTLKTRQAVDNGDKQNFTKYCSRKVRLENFKQRYIDKVRQITAKMADENNLVVEDKITENGVEYKLVYQEFAPEQSVFDLYEFVLQIGDDMYHGHFFGDDEFAAILKTIHDMEIDAFTEDMKHSMKRFKDRMGSKYYEDVGTKILWMNCKYDFGTEEEFWDKVVENYEK